MLELTPGKADLIEWTRGSLICREGIRGEVVWDALKPPKPFHSDRDPSRWLRDVWPGQWNTVLAEPATDLDGDGVRDLLWSLQGVSAFLALSGKDGSMLWNYAVDLDGLDGPGGPRPEGPVPDTREKPSKRTRYTLGTPAVVDLDRDGMGDLVATIAFSETQEEAKGRAPDVKARVSGQRVPVLFRRIVVAISGRSGRWIWSYPVEKSFTDPPYPTWYRAATVMSGQSPLIAIENRASWLVLDGATGRRISGPFELGFSPIRPLSFADLDRDGEPEVIALGSSTLAAFSSRTGEVALVRVSR